MNKHHVIKILILIILQSYNIISYSQDSIFSRFSDQEYTDYVLPPIDTLFYYAEQNPNIKIYEPRILEQETNIKSEKRVWLNYFRFSSSYQYGYIGAESLVQGYLIPAFYQNAQSAQSLYHIGVSISVPLDDIVDRKNKIKKHRHKLEEIKCEKDISTEIQKLTIVELYNKADEYMSLLKIRTEAKSFAQLLSIIGQKDFANGKIDLSELSRIKHSESVASSEFETIRIELKICLMKLEVICNYKFPIINTL